MRTLRNKLQGIVSAAAMSLFVLAGATAYADTSDAVVNDIQETYSAESASEVASVAVKTAPAKTSYYAGDSLDLAGGVITVTYTDATVSEMDMTMEMISGFDSAVIGEQTVTVTYGGASASFVVVVSEQAVTAAPVVAPESGTKFRRKLNVTISCPTENAVIYYTTDETEPTVDSILYEGEFTITATTTIKAVAAADGCAVSETVTAVYTLNAFGTGGGGGSIGGQPYTPPPPEMNGEVSSWSAIAAAIRQLSAGSEVTIELNGNYTVPEYVIAAIADVDARVTFVIDEMRNWYLDGALVEAPAEANLGATKIASLRTKSLAGTQGMQLRTYGTDVPALLNFDFGEEHGSEFANLYINNDGKLEYVGIYRTDEQGKVCIPALSEKGEYVVMLYDYSSRIGDVNNDGRTNAYDASDILKAITLTGTINNPVMSDHDRNGAVDEQDALAILVDVVFDRV